MYFKSWLFILEFKTTIMTIFWVAKSFYRLYSYPLFKLVDNQSGTSQIHKERKQTGLMPAIKTELWNT